MLKKTIIIVGSVFFTACGPSSNFSANQGSGEKSSDLASELTSEDSVGTGVLSGSLDTLSSPPTVFSSAIEPTRVGESIPVNWAYKRVGSIGTVNPSGRNTYFYGRSGNSGAIVYRAHIKTAGMYSLSALVIAPSGGDNSFYVSAPGLNRWTWHIPISRDAKLRNVGEIFLPEGSHDITFSVREDNTKISDIKLTLNSNEETLTRMPVGVPRTTMDNKECFISGEKEFYKKKLEQDRVSVSGCSQNVINPMETVESHRPYEYGTSGTVYNCSRVRKNYFHSEPINIYMDELIKQVDSTEQNSRAQGVHCAVNMYYL